MHKCFTPGIEIYDIFMQILNKCQPRYKIFSSLNLLSGKLAIYQRFFKNLQNAHVHH